MTSARSAFENAIQIQEPKITARMAEKFASLGATLEKPVVQAAIGALVLLLIMLIVKPPFVMRRDDDGNRYPTCDPGRVMLWTSLTFVLIVSTPWVTKALKSMKILR